MVLTAFFMIKSIVKFYKVIKKHKYIVSILIIISAYQLFAQDFNNVKASPENTISLEFSIVGDIMCHSTQYNYAMLPDSSFDFKPVFREIKKYFDNSDLVIGNLETVVAGKEFEYSGYPIFNTPEDFLPALKDAGFDILVTGNNHAFDQKEEGVLNTIDLIKKNNMQNSGTHKSLKERDDVTLFEKSGFRFALLSYTYDVNFYKIPNDKGYLVNKINADYIKQDIEKAKMQKADLVIVYFHFGTEYAREENNYQIDFVKKAISFGADIVLGAHPHSLQPVTFYKTKNAKIDSGFVAYSLGNFISNQRWRYSDGGTVLNFNVTKNLVTNQIELDAVRYLPIWVFKGITNWGLEYIILPSELAISDSYPSYLDEESKSLMLECYEDTREIIESRSTLIQLDSIEKSAKRKWIYEQEQFRRSISNLRPIYAFSQNNYLRTDTLAYNFDILSNSYLSVLE